MVILALLNVVDAGDSARSSRPDPGLRGLDSPTVE